MVTRGRDDAAPGQQQAGHNRVAVSKKCQVFELWVVDPSSPYKISRFEQDYVRVGEG